MTTLIIHPDDRSTDFLIELYEDIPDKIVVREFTPADELKTMMSASRQVIMCGHGNDDGLLCINYLGDMDYIVNEEMVDVLKTRTNSVFIWCNAADFVVTHNLCGMFSGMFISEVAEAALFGIETTQNAVDVSNVFFSKVVKNQLLQSTDICTQHGNIVREYSALAQINEIAAYNCARWFVRSDESISMALYKNTVWLHSVHPHTLLWSGGCKTRSGCTECLKPAQQPSIYYCSDCSWDICESCLRSLAHPHQVDSWLRVFLSTPQPEGEAET